MKIYSMTATFGKLEHQTLSLQPGLNVIQAPNEWGKSTWCAFLVNMLYGMDTRARTTKTELADKERYAPWSASPMAGRISLCWDGRDITIERRSKGRIPFGEFLAYETATVLPVPELNGNNCGQQLLGVERSVFTRSGFLRLSDLPVTQDEALRRRLNNLVTTGDESGAGDKLQQTLKDLKNKCRYNRTGHLPQAEALRDQLTGQLEELSELHQQTEKLQLRQQELEEQIRRLENHRAALRYDAAQADTQKVAQAAANQQEAARICADLTQNCDGLPSRQEAEAGIRLGQQLQQQLSSLQMETQMLPALPVPPQIPDHYRSDPDIRRTARDDFEAYTRLNRQRKNRNIGVTAVCILMLLVCAALAAARFLFFVKAPLLYIAGGAAVAMTGVFMLLISALRTRRWRDQVEALFDRHPGLSPDRWISDADAAYATCQIYEVALQEARSLRGDLDARQEALAKQIADFAKEDPLSQVIDRWQQTRSAWDALADATRTLQVAQSHLQTLQSMARTAEPPAFPDTLTHNESETDAFVQSARFELRQLQLKLGQFQGRSEALGQEAVLRSQLKAVNLRISRLEDTYSALELAQKALTAATQQLQRRFAPRISKRAQVLFGRLTGGRYDRLTLSEDFSLNASAQAEDTLRPAQWRSDGTVDQLYLALRLAVSEELTPQAPIILDDALARFDDLRLAAALDILKESAQNKQVILFTCQDRENRYLEEKA